MKKSKFVSSQEYKFDAHCCFEHIKGESQTVQGDSYTIQELFSRYANGMVVNVQRESYYEDTSDFDAIDFHALKYADPFEKQQLLLEVQSKAKVAVDAIEKWKREQEDSESSDSKSRSSTTTDKKSESDGKRAGDRTKSEPASAESGNSASAS